MKGSPIRLRVSTVFTFLAIAALVAAASPIDRVLGPATGEVLVGFVFPMCIFVGFVSVALVLFRDRSALRWVELAILAALGVFFFAVGFH